MDYSTKLVYQSNYWYNDGLKKANIRDLSGAVTSLKRSLQYNRDNIAARNLLGLTYYGRGEIGEALVEWILSKNFQPQENIANYYIQKLQETPGELETLNLAVKKYNQALGYAKQNGEDLAIIQLKKVTASHPTFVKAYQLIALLYLQTEQYSKARQALRAAHKLDTTDDTTLRYLHELNQVRKLRTVRVKEKEDDMEQQTVTYNIGNETIIQPVSSSFKDHSGIHTLVNISIGVLMGVAVMWFLIMPAITASRQDRLNQQTIEFSDQIAAQKAQISALKKELEGFRSNSEATQDAQTTAASTQESYEIVMNISKRYNANDMSDDAMVDELLRVNVDSLGILGRETFTEITDLLYPKMCGNLYETSQANFEVANYETAIANLERVMQMNPGYSDGAARLLLAQSYEKMGDQEKANIEYQKIIEEYPGTEAAASAQELLDAQNAGGGEGEDDTQDGGNAGEGEGQTEGQTE